MNLIEIQENLKDLPTQAIMAYANGQNPEVPPYMALGELNRRKSMEQRAAQAPTQSVKDQLEGEMGLPSVMPPPVTPQGMPPGMPPGRPPMPPQGMPQAAPQMARPPMQAAPQVAQAPQPAPRMAAGGLTNIPMNRDIFKYAPGGIVAFAEGDLVPGGGGELGEGTAGEAEAQANMGGEGPPITARMPGGVPTSALQGSLAPAVAMLQKILAGGDQGPPIETKADIRTKLAEKALADGKPEMAKAITQMPGEALSALVTKLQAQNEATKTQFQEGEGKMGLAALSNALIAAGEATRGQKGMGLGEAFGGFGKSYNAATADEIRRKQAQSALERQQDIETAKLQAEIDNARAAYASGDVNDIQEAQKRVQDQALKMQANQMGAAKDLISAAATEKTTEGTLAHYKQLEKNEALRLQEMIRQHADTASIQRQQLAAQQANYASEAAHRKAQDDLALATKPTAAEKLDQQTQAKVNGDKKYQKIADQIPFVTLGSDEYYNLLEAARQIAITHYAPGMRLPPPVQRDPSLAPPPAKPSFISSLFGGSKPAAAPASNAVRFEDLPK
jgi:hypothetical protein